MTKITREGLTALRAGGLFEQVRAAATIERQRAVAIIQACRAVGRSDLASHYIAEGLSLPTVEAALAAAAPKPQPGNPAPAIGFGFDPALILAELAKNKPPTLQ